MNCAIVYYMQRLGITNLRKMAILISPCDKSKLWQQISQSRDFAVTEVRFNNMKSCKGKNSRHLFDNSDDVNFTASGPCLVCRLGFWSEGGNMIHVNHLYTSNETKSGK
jgi:hypothetical protein